MGNSGSSAANCNTEGLQKELDEQRQLVSDYSKQVTDLKKELSSEREISEQVPGLQENNANLNKQLENKQAEVNAKQSEIDKYVNETIPNLNKQISEKEAEISSQKNTISARNATIKKFNDETIPNLNGQISAKEATIKKYEDETIPNLKKQQEAEIKNLNNKYDTCEKANDKLIIALRRYQSADNFVKLLFDNKDWLMYIVNDFDNNWKKHKWFKYLWNIAFTFKNTTKVIVLFGAQNNGISPVRSPANFKSINKGFIAALEVDPQLTAYNMVAVITNPLLASKYNISFWGAHRQKKGDDASYTYQKTLGHDQANEKRHENLNQTAWMWNWINTTVYDPKKYPKVKATPENVTEFTKKNRIVGTVNVTNNNRNSDPNVTKVEGWYAKRPTAAG